jgi:hypothetical protein
MLGAAAIGTEKALVATAPRLSVTRNVKLLGPTVFGVPVIAPVPAFRFSPSGRDPTDTDQVRLPVPPVAVAVFEYAVPTVPPGNEVVVNEGAPEMFIENA